MTPKFQVLLQGVPKTSPKEHRMLLGIDDIADETTDRVGGIIVSTIELEYEVGKVATLVISDLSNPVQLKTARPNPHEGTAGLILVFTPSQPETWDLLRANYEEIIEKLHEVPALVIANHKNPKGADLSKLGLGDPAIRAYIDDNKLVFCEGNPAAGGIPDEVFAEFVKRVVATGKPMPMTGEEREEEERQEEESTPPVVLTPKPAITPAAKVEPKPAIIPAAKVEPKPAIIPAAKVEPKPAIIPAASPILKVEPPTVEKSAPAPSPMELNETRQNLVSVEEPKKRGFMKKFFRQAAEEKAEPTVVESVTEENARWKCPKCGNNNSRMMRELEDKSQVLNVYPPIYGKKLKCGQCGAEWRKK